MQRFQSSEKMKNHLKWFYYSIAHSRTIVSFSPIRFSTSISRRSTLHLLSDLDRWRRTNSSSHEDWNSISTFKSSLTSSSLSFGSVESSTSIELSKSCCSEIDDSSSDQFTSFLIERQSLSDWSLSESTTLSLLLFW